MARRTVRIVDGTLRDGEQAPGVVFHVDEKIAFAEALSELGVETLDAGFPTVSENERRAFQEMAHRDLKAKVGATVRCHPLDLDLAKESGVQSVFMFHAVSDLHMQYKLVVDRQEVESRVAEMCTYSAKLGLETYFVAEDSARQEAPWVARLCDIAAENGAAGAILCDTVGVMTPLSMKRHVDGVRQALKSSLSLGIHCHNDFGLATANTLAAVEAGVDLVTCTVCAIGERAGNAALEEVVTALEILMDIGTGIELTRLPEVAAQVERMSGFFLPPHKAVVGRNVFTHESGVHVQGMLANRQCYESIDPHAVGRETELVLGKHSGRALVRSLLEQRGVSFTNPEVSEISNRIKRAKEEKSKDDFERVQISLEQHYRDMIGVSEEEFWRIAEEVLSHD